MGRKYVLLDDLDGSELPDDTQPVTLSLGRTTYSVYLSEANHGKLMEALSPFIENAETTTAQATSAASSSGSKTKTKEQKEYDKKVRAWAQSSGFKYDTATEKNKTLGDRGQIPQAVYEGYEQANG